MEAGGILSQTGLIEQFYDSIRADLVAMLERKKVENIRILSNKSNSDLGNLIKARI